MQNLSFDFHDPVFQFNGLRFSIQIFTHENVFGVSLAHAHDQVDENRYSMHCEQLTWAGGQEFASGWAEVDAVAENQSTSFRLRACAPQEIRCIKLTLKDCPMGHVTNLREDPNYRIPQSGSIFKYPDGWRGLYTPQIVVRGEHGGRSYRSLDCQVREKRFVLLPHDDVLDVELIFEELATRQGIVIEPPVWEVRELSDGQEDILQTQSDHVAMGYGLQRWETRPDVPDWMRQVALVAAIHCQHWTGYIFNDYASVLEKLRWLADQFEPTRTLVYLPGWEGRYYYRYGTYQPDPRMGGEAAFATLCEQAHRLGFHLMPMFGMNCVSVAVDGYQYWGAPAARVTGGGAVHLGGSVDWDGSRHYDHAWGVLVNPGAPTWQNRLVHQVNDLINRYHFEAMFLDISAGWWNDPKFNVFAGTLDVVRRIREGRPNVLVAGEGWYDGMGAATPLVQSGHTDGVMHWHDSVFPGMFDPYCRSFAHLCLGDPGRGSSGVHELGINPVRRGPVTLANIPTMTIVEDSFELGKAGVMEILEDAQEYAQRFLGQYNASQEKYQ